MIKAQPRKPEDRRGQDRRQGQVSTLPFPDRRKAERRSSEDRRGEPQT